MTFPPRWDKPHFKEPRINQKIRRRVKRMARAGVENKSKREVRNRDKRCRVPLCGCKKLGLALHVSHAQHKGMGGNPKGDRSSAKLMVYVCIARHREHPIAIDKNTLRWEPTNKRLGANGPIRWSVLQGELPARLQDGTGPLYWIDLGVESEPGKFIPSTGRAVSILQWMGTLQA